MNPSDKKWKEKKLNHYPNRILYDNKEKSYVQGDWDTTVMKAHAEITCRNGGHILECGFGMGISATHIQKQNIKSHTIIELNDEIYEKAVEWAKDKPNTKIISGDWKTVELNEKFDGILYDAGEQAPTDKLGLSLLPLYMMRFCKVGTIVTMYNHLWQPKTIWTPKFFDEDKIKFYEVEIPEHELKQYVDPTHKIYYLPEWIITEEDAKEKWNIQRKV